MTSAQLLTDAFGRVREVVHEVVDGLAPDELAYRVDSGRLLTGYYDAVHERTIGYVRTLTDDDLARIVDRRWDPPVTLAVRLVSVISDDLQHAGQAAYVRGIIERR